MRPGGGHSFRHKPLKKSRIYIVVFLLSLTKSAQKTQREFNYLSNIKLHAIPFQWPLDPPPLQAIQQVEIVILKKLKHDEIFFS